MRVALTAFLLCVMSAASATHAADLSIEHGGGVYDFGGVRAGMLVGFDFEPGVTIRPYWLPPWENRHYFPFGISRHRAGPQHGAKPTTFVPE